MLLLTLRGTPTIYMGEELGMADTPIPPDKVREPAELREPGRKAGRNPERTPFLWQGGPGAGFTTGVPWPRIDADVPLDRQAADPNSMVPLYRRLIALRRAQPALVAGSISGVAAEGNVLRYDQRHEGGRLAVMLNMGSADAEAAGPAGTVITSTDAARTGQAVGDCLALRPHQGIVIRPQG